MTEVNLYIERCVRACCIINRERTTDLRKQFYAEHNKNLPVLNRVSDGSILGNNVERVNKKPAKMTTIRALASGQIVDRSVALYKRKAMTQTNLLATIEEQPFKGVSVFATFFGSNWDMIKRACIDPAHEVTNLVKDMLGLMLNKGAMEFKPKRLVEEKLMNRYKNLASNKDAPWRISARFIAILCSLMSSTTLKVADAWPRLLNYFSDDYEKIKLAESMAFCGDRGCYFVGLTDIQPKVKKLFLELLRVAGGFLKKTIPRVELDRFV